MDDIQIFPRMLEGTNLILSEVVDVLLSAVEQEVGTPRAYVEVCQHQLAFTARNNYVHSLFTKQYHDTSFYELCLHIWLPCHAIVNSFHAKLFWLLLRYKHQRMSIKTYALTYVWRKSH